MAVFSRYRMVTDGLVLYIDSANKKSYPGSGAVWTDMSGHRNDGAMVNIDFEAINSGVMQFSQDGDYVSFGNNTSLNPTSMSICVWVNWDSLLGYNTIMARWSASAYSYYLTNHANSGQLDFYVKTAAASFTNLRSISSEVAVGNWYYIVATYDENTGVLALYKNGNIVSCNQMGSIPSGAINSTTLLTGIGRDINRNLYQFYGKNAITQMYNRSLSQPEVIQNFNVLRRRFGL